MFGHTTPIQKSYLLSFLRGDGKPQFKFLQKEEKNITFLFGGFIMIMHIGEKKKKMTFL